MKRITFIGDHYKEVHDYMYTVRLHRLTEAVSVKHYTQDVFVATPDLTISS